MANRGELYTYNRIGTVLVLGLLAVGIYGLCTENMDVFASSLVGTGFSICWIGIANAGYHFARRRDEQAENNAENNEVNNQAKPPKIAPDPHSYSVTVTEYSDSKKNSLPNSPSSIGSTEYTTLSEIPPLREPESPIHKQNSPSSKRLK